MNGIITVGTFALVLIGGAILSSSLIVLFSMANTGLGNILHETAACLDSQQNHSNKQTKTHMKTSIITAGIALGLGAAALIAQEFDGPPGQRGQGGPGGSRQGPPIMIALDTNKDGKLDATEIANASKSLMTLDKNNDGELTQDEIGGPRRGGGPGGPGDGPGRRQRPQE